jgi:hypothetical protein
MSLPRHQSVSVWLEGHQALLIVGFLVLVAVNFWYDYRHPIFLALDLIAIVVLSVAWFLKLFFDFEDH